MTDRLRTRTARSRRPLVPGLASAIVVVCVLLTLQAEIASIGRETIYGGIRLIGVLWLSDIGLLAPPLMVAALWGSSRVLRRRLVPTATIGFAYGLLLFWLNRNPAEMLGNDVRTCLAFVTGTALAMIAPRGARNLSALLAVLSLVLCLLGLLALVFTPYLSVLGEPVRATNPITFQMFVLPSLLVGPAILLSRTAGDLRTGFTSTATLALMISATALVLQTRSSVVALVAVLIGVGLGARKAAPGTGRRRPLVRRLGMALLLLVLAGATAAVFGVRQDSFDLFLSRIQSAVDNPNDPGVRPRLDEIDIVFSSLRSTDALMGVGLNPPFKLVDYQGRKYNTMHIGILNIAWRFGLVLFGLLLLRIASALGHWLWYVVIGRRDRAGGRLTRAYAVCMPGGLGLLAMSLSSGGWGAQYMLGLGLLVGMFDEMTSWPEAVAKGAPRAPRTPGSGAERCLPASA